MRGLEAHGHVNGLVRPLDVCGARAPTRTGGGLLLLA